jgi:hypothetical protein
LIEIITNLGADGFNVGARQIVFRSHEFLQINVVCKRHPTCVDVEDSALRLLVRERKFDLAVDPTWTDQRCVQRLNLVGGLLNVVLIKRGSNQIGSVTLCSNDNFTSRLHHIRRLTVKKWAQPLKHRIYTLLWHLTLAW